MWELKELKPEDVKVGDVYFTVFPLFRGIVPAKITEVERNRFFFRTVNGSGSQSFNERIKGLLVKERTDGTLELYAGKETLDILKAVRLRF